MLLEQFTTSVGKDVEEVMPVGGGGKAEGGEVNSSGDNTRPPISEVEL